MRKQKSLSPKSGYRLWEKDMRKQKSLSPKSGYRFWEKDMRKKRPKASRVNANERDTV
ncbi:MAG: hypothetical protein ACTSY1_03345 [Alphaproteobacteria bacterium]